MLLAMLKGLENLAKSIQKGFYRTVGKSLRHIGKLNCVSYVGASINIFMKADTNSLTQ